MKKRVSVFCLLFMALSAFAVATASASPITFTYTADNSIIGAWYIQSNIGTPTPFPSGSYADSWPTADTVTFDLIADPAISYQIIWQVVNSDPRGPSTGNPGGFLGEIKTSETVFKADWLSSSLWQVTFVAESLIPPTDFNSLAWTAATQYGANNDPTIWNLVRGGPIEGISGDAQWIWTAANFADGGAPSFNDSVFIRTTVTDPPPTQAVPEPSTLLLLGSGLAGVVGFRKRVKK